MLATLLIATCAARPVERTLYYHNQTPDAYGHYSFEFQTSNGITTKGAGNEHGAVGVVQYVSKEGLPITFTYVADDSGYQPGGDHEQPHLRHQLEYIRTHPAVDEPKSRLW
ncbi:pupal cuticle protein Edg-78E [Drosophila grimshawi]|uniref:GH16515 n=1 Tax=Drosophila grimshawi TaxID=7222 RepID=B4J123_DROGR|nr:pupal cuticle protein Edg-78E [Drosophila grimshawi]EDV96878.1 GH16515 [Drosophila grimshawi]